MKVSRIKRNRNIIRFKNEYYVVDDKTSIMLKKLQQSTNVQDFATKMNISEKKASKKLKQLQACLSKERFYKKNLFLDSPIKVQWKITNKCNLRCKHCYLGELSQETLSSSKLLEVARKIIDSGVLEVTITGGEALLVENLQEIINEFVENEIYVKVFTNATLLITFLENLEKENLVDKFKEYVTFSISVDGLESTHDKIRGKGTFKKVENALIKLQNFGFVTVVNCVVSKLNFNDIPKLVLYLKSLNICNIQLSNLIVRGKADSTMALSKSENNILVQKVKKLTESCDMHVMYGEEEGFENIKYFDSKIKNGYFNESWKCCAGVTRITIDHKGNVYCCPFCEDLCLGNIITQGIHEVWMNKNRFLFLDRLSKTKIVNGRMCIIAQKENKNE